jgi:hypothetical protein
MSQPFHRFAIGDRVRISTRCFDTDLRGAVGVVSPKIEASVNLHDENVVWIEFDPWIQSEDGPPIEAAEVEIDDLEPIA